MQKRIAALGVLVVSLAVPMFGQNEQQCVNCHNNGGELMDRMSAPSQPRQAVAGRREPGRIVVPLMTSRPAPSVKKTVHCRVPTTPVDRPSNAEALLAFVKLWLIDRPR